MTQETEPFVEVVGPPGTSRVELATGTGLTKFLDPLRMPPLLCPHPGQQAQYVTIEMCATELKLHSELPPTPLWTYAGYFPGPTIEVRRGQKLWVNWTNRIDGPYPVVAVELDRPVTPVEGPFPQVGNTPGREEGQPRLEIAGLPPWNVVHLHGARTGGGNDGLPENAVLPGNSQLAEYANDQQATALWYHDHAMDITRYNVTSGLVGMYLIRDAEEDSLGLPRGEHEVPLIICDRNLDTDSEGRFTGQLLYKTVALTGFPLPEGSRAPLQFFGPYTLVNGVIWPHFDVDARWYRFRILNASSSRFYRLSLLDTNNNPVSGAITQIGTDGGLLPRPVRLDGELILAPAERADVLIDFSAFRGQRLRLVNTGAGQVNVQPPIVPGQTDPGSGLVEPDVMQFRVRSRQVHDDFALPDILSPSFVRITHDSLPHDHMHRWLVILPPGGFSPDPELWEMTEVHDLSNVTIPSEGVIQVRGPDNEVITLKMVARHYDDTVSFFVEHGAWEQWKILNIGGPSLGGLAHPIHIHLIRFQALSRDLYDTSTFIPFVRGNPNTGGTAAPAAFIGPGILDPNEQGWKDTIRVGRGELVSVAGQFVGGNGRFVFHCHLLDHEDHGMMRPFNVRPAEVLKLMPHGGGDHHG
jgi:o-aminophenol oxidase